MARLIQIIAFLLGVFFIYKSYKLVKNKREDIYEFFLWVVIGVFLVVLSIDINIIDTVLIFMNMSSRENLVFGFGVLISLFLIFMLFKEIKNLELKISELNESVAKKKYREEKDQ